MTRDNMIVKKQVLMLILQLLDLYEIFEKDIIYIEFTALKLFELIRDSKNFSNLSISLEDIRLCFSTKSPKFSIKASSFFPLLKQLPLQILFYNP